MEHGLVAGIHPAGSGERPGGERGAPARRGRGPAAGAVGDRRPVPAHPGRGHLDGTARFLMLTVGAPSLEFLREVGGVYATGPTLERLVEVAGRHGVRPAFDLPGA
jgi:hypothetical protein